MATISKILIDDAAIYIETPAADGSGYALAGYTDDGASFEYAPEVAQIPVHEETIPIGAALSTEAAKIMINMAESNLALLNQAIAGASVTSHTLTIGGGVLLFHRVKLVTTDPDDATKYRKYEIFKACSTAAVAMSYKKDDKTIVPIEYTAIKDATYGVSKITKNLATQTS